MVVQGRSWVQGSDNTGIRWVRVFFVYRWGLGKRGRPGFYLFSAIRKYRQPTAILRVRRPLKRGQRIQSMFIRSRGWVKRNDGTYLRSWDNGCTFMRFPFVPRGTRMIGACFLEVRRPRILGGFNSVV